MSSEERALEKLERPWEGWESLDEDRAIEKLVAAVEEARAAGAESAARLAIIGVGNYAYLMQDWPALLDRANDLLDEIDGEQQSKRWG